VQRQQNRCKKKIINFIKFTMQVEIAFKEFATDILVKSLDSGNKTLIKE
jgi:hypothetical protein